MEATDILVPIEGDVPSQIEDDPIEPLIVTEETNTVLDDAQWDKEKKDKLPARFTFKQNKIDNSKVLKAYSGSKVLKNNPYETLEERFNYQIKNICPDEQDNEYCETLLETIGKLDEEEALTQLRKYFDRVIQLDIEKFGNTIRDMHTKQLNKWVDLRKQEAVKELKKIKIDVSNLMTEFITEFSRVLIKVSAALDKFEDNNYLDREQEIKNIKIDKSIFSYPKDKPKEEKPKIDETLVVNGNIYKLCSSTDNFKDQRDLSQQAWSARKDYVCQQNYTKVLEENPDLNNNAKKAFH